MRSLLSLSWTSAAMQSGGCALSFKCSLFLSLPAFQSNIANVIFHESYSIYQGQWHIEEADECLTPLDLYNERWESETHSEVVSTCTKEVEMIYSGSESQCFRELNLGHRQCIHAITPLRQRRRLLVRHTLINAWITLC